MPESINLIGWREKQREKSKQRLFIFIAVASLSIFVSQWAVGQYLKQQKVLQQEKLITVEQQIEALDKRLLGLKSAKNTQSVLLQRIDKLEFLKKEAFKVTSFSNLLPFLVPEGVYIDSIILKDSGIEIEGFSETATSMTNMLDAFDSEPSILAIEMHSIAHGHQRFGRDFQKFILSFQYKHLQNKRVISRLERGSDGES
jgi:type IV pilus assembly protein PilN